jgi:hypothetical protein
MPVERREEEVVTVLTPERAHALARATQAQRAAEVARFRRRVRASARAASSARSAARPVGPADLRHADAPC